MIETTKETNNASKLMKKALDEPDEVETVEIEPKSDEEPEPVTIPGSHSSSEATIFGDPNYGK